MGATIQGYGQSTISVKPGGIDIRLPKEVFRQGWSILLAQLLAAIGKSPVIVFSQRVMTQRGPEEDAPRWIPNGIDVLSWLLFLLKVPTDHELVKLWSVIDWAEINRIASPVYKNAHGGRLAWAPAQLVALLVLMFLYGVPHETTVLARLKENIVWCWFCGFGLFGPFPAHDALYELRKRLGVAGFERLLTLAVQGCIEAGLVSNALVLFDLTAVVASAYRWSPYERAVILSRALIRYLELVWTDRPPEEPLPEALRRLAAEVALEVLPHKALKDVKPERVLESVAAWEQQAEAAEPAWETTSEAIVEALVEEAADEAPPLPPENAGAPPGSSAGTTEGVRGWLSGVAEEVMGRLPHTRGDPDARVGRTTRYTWFCGYWMGFVVDGLHQVITAVVWGIGNLKQVKLFEPALEAHIQRVGTPAAAAADSAFDDPEVHTYLDEHAIVGHITPRAHAPPRDGGYGTDRVTWEVGMSEPVCPSGQPLIPKGNPQQGRQTYEGSACDGCPLYQRCYPSGEGQPKPFTLNQDDHRRWQANRVHSQTEAYKAAQRERFTSEGRFGLAKANHHGDKAPYRSDAMNHIAGLMIAFVMDVRVLAQHQPTQKQAA
jgi:transposase